MSGPGKGRYTNYTPLDVKSKARYDARYSLFNAKSSNDSGKFPVNADTLAANAKALLSAGTGDAQMFPQGVQMNYSGAQAFNTENKRAGDPSNAYVPDISSPGATGTDAVNVAPHGPEKIDATIMKPNHSAPTAKVGQNANNLGTQSPVVTSTAIGSIPIGTDLTIGKSQGSA